MKNEIQVTEQIQMITPAGTVEQAIEQFNLYQELRKKLGKDEDFQPFRNKKTGETKKHPKKSFVRKIQRFFNISCEITQDEPLKDGEGNIVAWLAKARAIHIGTGVFQEADGSCSYDEKVDKYGKPIKAQQTIHNIRAHAITRAKNRAILDLVGFGEVSAEEITDEYDQKTQPTEAERKTNGLQAMSAEADKKKLTQEERAAIITAETNKKNDIDLTLNEIISMYNFFKDTSAKVLKETAETLLNPKDEKKIYDVDPETGVATEVIEMRDKDAK